MRKTLDIFIPDFNTIHSYKEVKNWLTKNLYNFKRIKKRNIYDIVNYHFEGEKICNDFEEDHCFISLYQNLLEFIEYHHYEKYAQEQLEIYENIKNDKNALKEWLKINEKFASEDLAILPYYYYENLDDYINNDNDNFICIIDLDFDLLVFEHNNHKFYVYKKDLINLLNFKKIFDELYYRQELYPEGLAKIEEEMRLARLTQKY